jgi:hypothetical protein
MKGFEDLVNLVLQVYVVSAGLPRHHALPPTNKGSNIHGHGISYVDQGNMEEQLGESSPLGGGVLPSQRKFDLFCQECPVVIQNNEEPEELIRYAATLLLIYLQLREYERRSGFESRNIVWRAKSPAVRIMKMLRAPAARPQQGMHSWAPSCHWRLYAGLSRGVRIDFTELSRLFSPNERP